MANKTNDHAGSGIDKPDPKTLMEKVGDTMKAVLPKKTEDKPTGNGTVQPVPK